MSEKQVAKAGSGSYAQKESKAIFLEPVTYKALGMDDDFVKQCIIKEGTVIFSSEDGEGKSASLASIIRYILENDTIIKGTIVTHEHPIEYAYHNIQSEKSLVMQVSSEKNQSIEDFDVANSAAMRRSPALIVIGELKDTNKTDKVVELSATGHPIFATTGSSMVSGILPILIGQFPKEIQVGKAHDIISSVKMLVAQKLVQNIDGQPLAVREALEVTNEVRDHLLDVLAETNQVEALYKEISNIIESGRFGSTSYERQATELLNSGVIDSSSYECLVKSELSFAGNGIH